MTIALIFKDCRQICSKELNPKGVTVCKRFEVLIKDIHTEVDSCKLNAEFEISKAANEPKFEAEPASSAKEEKDVASGGAAAEEAAEPDAPAAHAGTLEEQLVQTNLW